MSHWSEQYIGEPYVEGANDCAALAARVAREQFGRVVALPEERAAGIFGQSAQIKAGAAALVDPVESPDDGDLVLMVAAGRISHVGVFCRIDNVAYVLHAMRNAGAVVLHRLFALKYQGLEIEGFYRWK